MDRDLNRSIRLLEDALSPHGKSLLRTATPKRQKPISKMFDLDEVQDITVIQPVDLRDETQILFSKDDSMSLLHNQTTIGVPFSSKPWESAINSLYMEYLEVIQAHNNVPQVFDTVSDLARCCADTLNVVRGLKSKVKGRLDDEERWLENERNTWRLIFCLYQDRLGFDKEDKQAQYFGVSEKLCIENLYRKNALMRESQLIIDWLECNAHDRESVMPRVEYFTDRNIGWENTVHQLTSADTIVFKSSRRIVTKIDPDASIRQKLPLHDLDEEDDERLCKKIFMDIRCGKFEEAQKLCMHCGHAWRAALLEGWRLHHDPNANHNENVDKTVRHDTQGNENRDLWKKIAWDYCLQTDLHIYERATVAAFCGCLDILLLVCKTWEDVLWAYLKTMVDIRVESEIRDYVSRNYIAMPPEYWKNKMSLDGVFSKISSYPVSQIKIEAEEPDHLIQKYIILDQIPQLMLDIEKWLYNSNTSPHFIRFLAHLVLFLRQIGHIHRDDIAEKVLEAYVKILIERNEPQIIAYYTATLGKESQIEMYSLYLENISDNNERREALQYAEDTGLDVQSITKYVTEMIISKSDEDITQLSNLHKPLTESDKTKISALDWVLFYPSQSAEAINQSNSLVSYFLILGKMEAAKLAFSKIPLNFIDHILSNSDEVPEYIHRWIREHLCYKSYLDAHEAFNDWFKFFHQSRPVAPPELPENVGFSDKVAHEHKLSQYQADCDRWKMTVNHLAKTAKTMLYNVLLFPDGGWLTGTENAEHLRGYCIPEAVMLLYTVLFEIGELTECLQLADIIACEKYCLYKVFTKHKLEDFLQRISETSVRLVEEKNDMWLS